MAVKCLNSSIITINKGSGSVVDSPPFYTHHQGYKFILQVTYYSPPDNDIGAALYLMKGEYDSQLKWPLRVKVRLDLLNQAADGDHHHVGRMSGISGKRSSLKQLTLTSSSMLQWRGAVVVCTF